MTIESITGRIQAPLNIKSVQKTEVNDEKIASEKKPETSDSIVITEIAQGLNKAFASSSATSSIDIDRVNSVKKALAEGGFPINAERIAKKMIQLEKSLL